MATNIPIELLRSFVATINSGSMTRAAEQSCLTQSALSLQMKRLAEIVGAPLFDRHRRGLLLTSAGESLLLYARGILDLNDRALTAARSGPQPHPARIGMAQDFASPLLSSTLVRFMERNPELRLQLKIDKSPTLSAQFAAGLLDIELGLAAPDDADAVGVAQMAWIGDPALANSAEIPLAIMEAPCRFRQAAVEALEKADRPYRFVIETPSVAILRAAIESGLAITCRTPALLGAHRPAFIMPDALLPQIGFVMRVAPLASPTMLRLEALIRRAIVGLEASPV